MCWCAGVLVLWCGVLGWWVGCGGVVWCCGVVSGCGEADGVSRVSRYRITSYHNFLCRFLKNGPAVREIILEHSYIVRYDKQTTSAVCSLQCAVNTRTCRNFKLCKKKDKFPRPLLLLFIIHCCFIKYIVCTYVSRFKKLLSED